MFEQKKLASFRQEHGGVHEFTDEDLRSSKRHTANPLHVSENEAEMPKQEDIQQKQMKPPKGADDPSHGSRREIFRETSIKTYIKPGKKRRPSSAAAKGKSMSRNTNTAQQSSVAEESCDRQRNADEGVELPTASPGSDENLESLRETSSFRVEKNRAEEE